MNLKPLIYQEKHHHQLTDAELAALPVGDVFVYDVECYVNYFICSFKHVATGGIVVFEHPFSVDKLNWMLFRFLIVGFNSNSYDVQIIKAAVHGADPASLKALSNDIIYGNDRRNNWSPYNHIDLIEVAPLQASLKAYAARLHCERMQELPIHHDAVLTEAEKVQVRNYNWNDLDNTVLLWLELLPHIKLRERLGQEYGVDLRSKSDAQLAETVINTELKRLTGRFPKKPEFNEAFTFQYKVPTFIRFSSEVLQAALDTVAAAQFKLGAEGKTVAPESFELLKFRIGNTVYKMGLGGLHSTEKSIGYKSDEEFELIDRDVASYYPFVILNQRLYPAHLGESFLEVYRTIVERRLAAKRSGDKTTSDALKITINGSFGKFGNMYSTLYSPDLLIQVTLTGQLALLMLIERIENVGIPVVSGNTDGIIIKCPVAEREKLNAIVFQWEKDIDFETDKTEYKAIYSRDVNNYIAVKPDGSCKAKGVYSEKGSALNSVLSKNPETLILSDAVQNFISQGISIDTTIRNCKNITRFIAVRNVKGGAQKDGYYLGKVVRWYYAKHTHGTIRTIMHDSKVPKTEGAKPLMQLGPFPDDIDYEWYIREANEMLYNLGYYEKPKQLRFF